MCFSARASFGAAAALGGIGGLSVRAAPTRRHLALAAVPLVFAAQQACEGAVWLALDAAPFHVESTPLARAFLFFALFVWPLYVPSALVLIERVPARRAALWGLAAAGGMLGVYLMACATLRASNACIAYGNLYYWVRLDVPAKHAAPFVYLALVSAPLLVSSVRGTSWLALSVAVAFATTGVLYRAGFLSVWCFFAAILSGLVAVVVQRSSGARLAPGAAAGRH